VAYAFNPFTGTLDILGPTPAAPITYTQSTPASTWIITHNLGRVVNVTLYNATGVQVESDVVASSSNVVTVTFASPQTGSALIS